MIPFKNKSNGGKLSNKNLEIIILRSCLYIYVSPWARSILPTGLEYFKKYEAIISYIQIFYFQHWSSFVLTTDLSLLYRLHSKQLRTFA